MNYTLLDPIITKKVIDYFKNNKENSSPSIAKVLNLKASVVDYIL